MLQEPDHYMMVPFLGGCDGLKGVLWAVEKTETEKLHFLAHLRWLSRVFGIDLFHQESVHRCGLGCSPWFGFLNKSPIGRLVGQLSVDF